MKKLQQSAVMASAIVFVLAASSARAVIYDSATKGDWIGKYGAAGYILTDYGGAAGGTAPLTPVADVKQLPGWISTYSYTASADGWNYGTSTDHTYLENPNAANPLTDPRVKAVAYQYSPTTFTITLNLTQAKRFQLGIYGQTKVSGGTRTTDLQVTSGAQIQTATFQTTGLTTDSYYQGEWAVFDVTATGAGPVTILVTPTVSQSLISGITFDTIVPEPGTVMLFGIGGGILWLRRRRQPRSV